MKGCRPLKGVDKVGLPAHLFVGSGLLVHQASFPLSALRLEEGLARCSALRAE